jgi:excisionase family DNA binding protein
MKKNQNVIEEKPFYSCHEVEKLLGINYLLVLKECQRGHIPSVLIGKRRLIPREGIEALKEEAMRGWSRPLKVS